MDASFVYCLQRQVYSIGFVGGVLLGNVVEAPSMMGVRPLHRKEESSACWWNSGV